MTHTNDEWRPRVRRHIGLGLVLLALTLGGLSGCSDGDGDSLLQGCDNTWDTMTWDECDWE